MFLITPRSKNNGVQGQASQPVVKIRAPARVQAACDRCRMKRVKCDGSTPCLRCSQDEVICVASRKSPTDPKAASFEYIRSLEAQQSHLIKALTTVTRHVRQPVGEGELKEILETVRKCGFDFEGAVGQLNIKKPISEMLQGRGPKDAEGGNGNHSRKRKRREEALDDNRIPTQVADSKEYSHLTGLDTVMPFQQDDLSFSEPVDDYWNLDAYWDQVAALFRYVPTTDSSDVFPDQQNYPLPFQEWDLTLLWDPSLLFNTTLDTSPS